MLANKPKSRYLNFCQIWCLAPSAHLLSVYIVKIRFKGGALWRSPFMPTVRLRLLPRGRSMNGEQEEESVLPSVRPSVPHQMTPPPNRPTSLWDFTLRPKVSRSFGPARLNCYNFSVAAVLREKCQSPNVPLRNDRKSSRSGSAGGK